MPKGNLLTDVEKGQIVALGNQCLSFKAISEAIGQSVDAVAFFSRTSNCRKDQFKCRNAAKFSRVQEESLQHYALRIQHSSKELQNLLNLLVTVSLVQQIFLNNPFLKYLRYIFLPRMTRKHQKAFYCLCVRKRHVVKYTGLKCYF